MNKPISWKEFAIFLKDESYCVFQAITFLILFPFGIIIFTLLKIFYVCSLIKEKVL